MVEMASPGMISQYLDQKVWAFLAIALVEARNVFGSTLISKTQSIQRQVIPQTIHDGKELETSLSP